MARGRIGERSPHYSYMLNPHSDVRLSKCPRCEKLSHPRKFALLIHIEAWGLLALGKTCRYCSGCELIMVHEDELEAELARSFSRIAPEVIGKAYRVLGTMEKKAWQEGLGGRGQPLAEMLKHVAEFKKVYVLEYEPAGRYGTDQRPRKSEGSG
ncbi:MAG: hypothetical protein A3H27_08065 [Acidobacteria bacterium RIFCSPLOWO2_02_FULL_59_13]|nr:MAG: hypothetical protein A3H27_08065 [Acidobacteria bacterium RIFCSPLOWO2_02_FULL_59_13]